MEVRITQQKLNERSIKLDRDCSLTSSKGEPIVICHCEMPWPHARLYTVEQYRASVYEMLDFKYESNEIENALGSVFSVEYPHHHKLNLSDESLKHLSVADSLATDVVLIYEPDGSVHVWDERTAPRDISDRSIGRYYRRNLEN